MRRPARIATRRADRPRQSLDTPSASDLLQAALSHHQAGNAPEAERLYRQVLSLDAEQPDALHLLGVLAFQLGRADVAVPLIEHAIRNRPAAPAFHLNLGNALLALGKMDVAIASYRQATVLAPADPESRYNLGNALVQRGDVEDGIAALRQAVQLRPDHVAAQYNLGNALRLTGDLEAALSAYDAVIQVQPTFADAHTNLGTTLHALGRYHEAQDCFGRVLAARPDDPTALLNLAEALREQGRLDEAATAYARVLDRAPDDPTALRGLAGIYQARNRSAEAAELLGRLVAAAPDDAAARAQFVRAQIAAALPLAALQAVVDGLERTPDNRALIEMLLDQVRTISTLDDHPVVRAALLAAVTDDTFDIQKVARPIARIVTAAPEYPRLVAAVRDGHDPFAGGLPLPASLLEDPSVLAALPRVVICIPEVEQVLTALRRFSLLRAAPPLLDDAQPRDEARPLLTPDGVFPLPGPFLGSLVGAAFLVEHVWHAEADEAALVQRVNDALTARLADPASDLAACENLLMLAALYGRLGRLAGAERLAEVPADRWSPWFASAIREQVVEPLEERALAASLPTLTPIANDTSQAVQAMYEENPYPRWRAARFHGAEPLIDRFRQVCPGEPEPTWPERPPVLVAGAGTGQHPIQTALRLPEADVLAVDLSRPSLAYGARMAARLGVANLTLAHGDILALGALEQRFALIECAGVLHHLADPLAGWSVLRRLLRPDGLMLIALYSELARARIVAARELIATEAIPSTAAGIREARRRIKELPASHPAAGLVHFWDFYSESGFRDLAMHVQEHRFTIPQLAASLDTLDLRFLGFVLPVSVMEQFRARFPSPGAERDLDCWDQFEASYPDTFAGMYQLWCRPR